MHNYDLGYINILFVAKERLQERSLISTYKLVFNLFHYLSGVPDARM
jgi:hypothetical protein